MSAPVGPMGLLCIQRSLNVGFKSGFITGLGTTVADGIYVLIVSFGLTTIPTSFLKYQNAIQFIMGLLILYIGAMQCSDSQQGKQNKQIYQSGRQAFLWSFTISLSNPATLIFLFAGIASLKITPLSLGYYYPFILSIGVILGSILLWTIVSFSFSCAFTKKLSLKRINGINIFFGIIIFLFGLFICLLAIKRLF